MDALAKPDRRAGRGHGMALWGDQPLAPPLVDLIPVPILQKGSVWEVLGFCLYKIAEVVRLLFAGATTGTFHPDRVAPIEPAGLFP